jgi:hypothetical protein
MVPGLVADGVRRTSRVERRRVAARGGLGLGALFLFRIVLLMTPPHFLALTLLYLALLFVALAAAAVA